MQKSQNLQKSDPHPTNVNTEVSHTNEPTEMFPVNDLNLVVCGIATFAATVGYACSRKLTADPRPIALDSSDPFKSTIIIPREQGATDEPGASSVLDQSFEAPDQDKTVETGDKATPAIREVTSLKRKRAHDDDHAVDMTGYPHNLSSIYPPKKRSRTPSSESDSEGPVAEKPTSPSLAENDKPIDPATTHESTREESVEATLPPSTPEPSPRVITETFSTPSPVFGSSATISSPLPKSSLRHSQRAFTSSAFSAFSGSSSPFSKVTPASSTFGKPAWMAADISSSKNLNNEVSDSVFNDGEEAITAPSPNSHVLAAATMASNTTVEHVTGEENEDVEAELKGVKLFVKRGNKPFSDGMIGHVKLLSDKTTLHERLLFRREPLWQVSMNVRMQPAVRCTFDAEEHIIRLILKEAIIDQKKEDVPPADWDREVVIYALKPGRSCSKQDFKDFADTLVKSTGLQAKVD
ncbi:hypothetical protein D9615_006515 [Tricholomella constricta]|uniref:RanBD1 domain-containing protein n=1 Tax=Tricholomella constricta TaxID=117010 RepID=A0A8H5HA13_9AGAR|nr:hypothetical protein D9615_006515 [Tricholomella constricta]